MEYFDILNPDGSRTGRKKERSLVHRDGDYHGTIHIWLFRRGPEGKTEVLLQKRSQNKDAFPGCYDISCAGHILAGEEPEPSALRELEEELGIKAEPEELIFLFLHESSCDTEFYGRRFCNHELAWAWALPWDGRTEELQLQKEEVESVMWITLERLGEALREEDPLYCIFDTEYAMLCQAELNRLCEAEAAGEQEHHIKKY